METKHNCPHCKKELTLENGILECQGPKHYYRTTPKELEVSQEFYDNFWKRTLFCDDSNAGIKVTAQNFYDDILEYNMTSEFAFGNKIELYYNKPLSSELIEKLQPYKLDDHLYYMDKNLIWIFYE